MTDVSKKPSERIHELAVEHAPKTWDVSVYRTQELVQGLIDYLDECWAEEQTAVAEFREWKRERGL